MAPGEGRAGQDERAEHDDEQRPQIVEQVGLDGRRPAQRDEQAEVIAEQAIDAEQQDPERRARSWTRRKPSVEPSTSAQPMSRSGGICLSLRLSVASAAHCAIASAASSSARRQSVFVMGFVPLLALYKSSDIES